MNVYLFALGAIGLSMVIVGFLKIMGVVTDEPCKHLYMKSIKKYDKNNEVYYENFCSCGYEFTNKPARNKRQGKVTKIYR